MRHFAQQPWCAGRLALLWTPPQAVAGSKRGGPAAFKRGRPCCLHNRQTVLQRVAPTWLRRLPGAGCGHLRGAVAGAGRGGHAAVWRRLVGVPHLGVRACGRLRCHPGAKFLHMYKRFCGVLGLLSLCYQACQRSHFSHVSIHIHIFQNSRSSGYLVCTQLLCQNMGLRVHKRTGMLLQGALASSPLCLLSPGDWLT